MTKFSVVMQALLFFLIGAATAWPRAEAKLVGKPAPEIRNDTWLNSPPLRLRDLRGRVVLMEFWTYG